MLNTLQIDSKFVVFAAVLGLLTFVGLTGSASATLAGENGPIVYVEETRQEVRCEDHSSSFDVVEPEEYMCKEEVSQVVTTDSEGQDPVTVVEFAEEDDEYATTATISPNDEDGNHEVIVGTTARECSEYIPEWDEVDVSAVRINDNECFYTANAVIYRVVIDKERNVVGEPEVVTVVEGEDGTMTYSNFYIELSYGPDGTTVVGTRFFFSVPQKEMDKLCNSECDEEEFGPKTTIERINLETGAVETLVDPVFDPHMNAGYAQDGTIYFTKTTFPEKPTEPYVQNGLVMKPQRPNSDVWYFAPGSSDAVQLTDTPMVNEYFLSVSPDSTRVLVCDPRADGPTYYLVNTETGELTIVQLEEGRFKFLPLFFSPDGEGYLGMEASVRMYRKICGERFEAFSTLARAIEVSRERKEPSVAYAAALDFENAVVYNNLQNPDDWAPIVAYEDEEEPEVLGETTTPKLQSTGSSIWATLAVGSLVTTTAGVASTRRKED